MSPVYAELVAALRSDGQALAAAGRLGLDEPVPTCPGWTVDRLLRHVVRVHGWGTLAVRARGDQVSPPPRFEGGDPVAGLLTGLDALVTTLESTTPESPAWNCIRPPCHAAWWARRMAAETAIHRWDAQFAQGFAERVPGDLAVDYLDEYFEVVLPHVLQHPKGGSVPNGVLHLAATDAPASWTVTLATAADGSSAGVVRDAADRPAADVSVRAAAVDLLLLVHNRPPQDTLELRGSSEWLAAWGEAVVN